ncbi:hypothetical protein CAPTEDRAFT_218492 [Capitella teleta]|uniref:Uncharacterized protein n=1 Tax=Capitella teleta TaxID=283909 RepID=R7VJJ6_CAPTE|nr:hypothetical protein CAPTEDRAFT_218492 [Capitella teleta]|eukprot:ELU18762.1 hypothetical protein CAPTEDRAFT_218492 [Capitella teleta]
MKKSEEKLLRQDDYSSPKKSSSDYDKPWQQSSGGSVDKSWRPPNEELVKVEAMKKDVEEEWRKVEEERKEMKAEQEVLKAEMHTIKEEMIRIKEEMHRERKRREDIEAELTTEKKRRREMDDRLLGESRKKKEIEVQLDLEKKKGLSLRREKDEEKARVLDQLKKDNQRQIERLEGQIQRLERKRTQEDDKRQVRYEPRPERGHHHSAPHSAGSHMRGGYGHPRERYDRPESPQLTSHGESVPFGDSLQPFQPVQAPHQDLGTMQSSMGMEGASLEDIQVEQIRRMTGIQDGHKVRSALRVLRSMDPNMVSSLGSIDPASLRQISSKHPGFLQGLLNNLRQNISDNKFF